MIKKVASKLFSRLKYNFLRLVLPTSNHHMNLKTSFSFHNDVAEKLKAVVPVRNSVTNNINVQQFQARLRSFSKMLQGFNKIYSEI